VPRRKKARQKRLIPRHLVDTNVILRFLIGDDQPNADRATALIEVDCMLAARGRERGIPVYTFDATDFKRLNVAWERPSVEPPA
jgi:predicted nucleic acid-binding protein